MKPLLTIIAGSNGCGKSTLTSGVRSNLQSSSLLDPDAIAKSLQETQNLPASPIEAGKRVLQMAEELMLARKSFTVETTLSGKTYLKMATRAKREGYDLMLVFVGTTSVEINLERVRVRVFKGGHDVPEKDQRRRYPRTLANMNRLLPQADVAIILDNSTERGHTLVAFGRGSGMHWIEPVPEWAAGVRG